MIVKFNNIYLCFQKTENLRVCFGKSGIHGWGLFARRNIQEGEMVLNLYVWSVCCVFKASIVLYGWNLKYLSCV